MPKQKPLKKPSIKINPTNEKVPKTISRFKKDDDTILFCFHKFNSNNEWYQGKQKQEVDFWGVCEKFKHFENIKWSQLAGNQERNHSIPIDKIIKPAQETLRRLQLDDYDEIWSLAFNGLPRLWGIKDNMFFMTIWWDPDHLVCPVGKKGS